MWGNSMRNYNYEKIYNKLLTPEIVQLLAQIHEQKGEYAAIISKLTSNLHEKNEFELDADEISALKGFMSLLLWRNPIFVHISNAVIDRQYAKDSNYIEYIQNEFPDIPANVVISHLAHRFLKEQLLILMLSLFDTMKDSQICIDEKNTTSFAS